MIHSIISRQSLRLRRVYFFAEIIFLLWDVDKRAITVNSIFCLRILEITDLCKFVAWTGKCPGLSAMRREGGRGFLFQFSPSFSLNSFSSSLSLSLSLSHTHERNSFHSYCSISWLFFSFVCTICNKKFKNMS